jgi:hypothetical protein
VTRPGDPGRDQHTHPPVFYLAPKTPREGDVQSPCRPTGFMRCSGLGAAGSGIATGIIIARARERRRTSGGRIRQHASVSASVRGYSRGSHKYADNFAEADRAEPGSQPSGWDPFCSALARSRVGGRRLRRARAGVHATRGIWLLAAQPAAAEPGPKLA